MKIRSIVTLISLSLVIVSCLDLSSKELPDYPGYREVIVRFLNEYSISGIEYPNQFALAKKPDGWHAMIVDVVEKETIQDELYWSRSQKRYMDVDFQPTTTTAFDPAYKSIIEDWNKNYFSDILPYWGYAGWDKDIIDEFGNKKRLPDTLLNALARAYVNYAHNLLSPNFEFSSKEVMFNLPEGQNALSEEQLAKYREFEHKGIETYYRLWQQNPDFESFVADIYNVYSNEVISSYLTISYFQNQEEAKSELKDGLFDPFIRDMAKRYLASCDQNAILITNGDTDTYPLLYIQENEGFRKDVSVVNISLLNDSRYISNLSQAIPGRDPVTYRLPDEFYWNSRGYFPVSDQVEPSPIIDVIDFVVSEDTRTKLQLSNEEVDYIPTKNIIMKLDKNNLPAEYSGSDDELELWIKLDRNYITLNHLCLLDIISTNNFKRPIYFGYTTSKENFLGMEHYFQCEGLAYKLTPLRRKISDDGFYTGFINTDIQFVKLLEDVSFHISDDNFKYYDLHHRTTRSYRMVYGHLAEKLIDEEKNDKALLVLEYCAEEFPYEKSEYELQSLILIESWYRIGQIDNANEIVETMYQACKNFLEGKIDENFDATDYETRVKLHIMQNLMQLTSQYDRGSDLSNEIEETFIFYYNKIQQF